MASAVGLGAALGALRRRSSGRHREQHRDDATSVAYSRPPGTESFGGDKFTESDYYSEPSRRGISWRDRLLGPAAGVGGFEAMRKLFGRRRVKDDDMPNVGPYGAPYQGPVSSSTVNFHAMEEGGPLTDGPMTPAANSNWRRVEDRERAQEEARARGAMQSRISDDSFETDVTPRKPGPGRSGRFGMPVSLGALGAIGGLGGLGGYLRKRREQREERRIEAEKLRDRENEHLYGGGSAQRLYTGDRTPRRNRRVGSNSPLTDHNGSPKRGATAPGRSLVDEDLPRAHRTSIPPPPRAGSRPPQPPLYSSSPSNLGTQRPYDGTNANHQVSQTSPPQNTPPAANAASGTLLSPPAAPGNHERTHSASPHDAVESPPLSIRLGFPKDGRHVTLRRLGEDEAAREREARRREKKRAKNGAGHGSDISDAENAGPSRFRRGAGTPHAGRSPQAQASGAVTPAQHSQPSELHLPPHQGITPPSGLGSSPLSAPNPSGTATDVSDYDSNRRRRRAERARAEQQKQAAGRGARSGNRVEFT